MADRRYHATSSAYVLPNDAIEHARLDVQADAITEMIGGKPFLAPLGLLSAYNIADVGCGTGIATLQLAHIFPGAKVYGIDISPVPDTVRDRASGNIEWCEANILDPGPLGDRLLNKIDYMFGRMLFLGINDWPEYFRSAYRSLASGGTIEHQDLDWEFYKVGTSQRASENWEWHQTTLEGVAAAGLSNQAGSDAATLMKTAGLEIVSVQKFEFSFNPSAKVPTSQKMGRYVQARLMPNYPELLRKMLSPLGIEGSKLRDLTEQCLHDLSTNEGVHQKYTVTIARKP